MKHTLSLAPLAALLLGSVATARALTLSAGSATLHFDTAALAATPYQTIDGVFGLSEDYADLVAASFGEAPPPLPPLHPSGNLVLGLNPAGITTSLNGRSPQGTTLDFAPGDVSGSWTTGSPDPVWGDLYLLGGEQIGFGGGVRITGDFDGVLLFGDFALRFDSSKAGVAVNDADVLSGLVITSNVGVGFFGSVTDATFADLANAQINFVDGTLTIEGDLLFAEGSDFMASGVVLHDRFGSLNLTASAVPEPSTYALVFGLFAGGAAFASRRKRAA